MRYISLVVIAQLAVAIPLAGQVKPPSAAKPYTVPKTPWGDPDIQGVWPSTSMIQTPLERDPKMGTRAVLNDEEYTRRQAQAKAYFERFEAERSTGGPVPLGAGWADYGTPNRQASLVVDPPDGRVPPLTPEAQKREDVRLERYRQKKDAPDTWEDLTIWDRCITLGIPGAAMPFAYNNGNEILQAPGYVVFRNELIHEARIIPLDGRPHVSSNIRLWMGNSRGHWEGNTLVVETTNFNAKAVVGQGGGGFGGPAPLPTEALRTIERFTRVDDKTLNYEVTIDDPNTWIKPWKIAFPLKTDPNYTWLYEYACHEGNVFMYDALSGARAEEEKAEEAKKGK